MAKMTLDQLVSQLRTAYEDDLVAVVLYGSAAGGEHIAKRSDYNVLVVLKAIGMHRLKAAAAVARAWNESGNPAPLTLTESEWKSSADIFPMEYADILERNRVLFGDAPFAGIVVDRDHLRLQLEHEAMGTLLKLRQGVLASGDDPKRLLELLDSSLSTLLVVFRAFVRLHGQHPSADNLALVQSIATIATVDASAFDRVVRHARGESPIKAQDARDLIAGYLQGMEQLVAYLDRYRHPSSPSPR
jgi:predicted nucleotidyltransferase